MKTKSGVFNKKMAVVKFLWPYNVFYSEFFAVFGSFFYNMRDLLTVR